MKICCACLKEKDFKNFYKHKTNEDGCTARCKMCYKEGTLCKSGRKKMEGTKVKKKSGKPDRSVGIKNSWNEIRLINTSKEDYVETYLFLKRIGYNLSESIHKQFCDKHGLEPIVGEEFSYYFSPKDCGLA
jgi:hypothetical protein